MHCAGQLLRLKWACFSLGEQFSVPGRLRKGLFPLHSSPPTPSTPGFPLGSLIPTCAFGRLFKLRIHGHFTGLSFWYCACSHPAPLHQRLPNDRKGQGVACKLCSDFFAALDVPVPPLQKVHLGEVLNRGFQPGWVAWADSVMFGWGRGIRTVCSWVLEAAMMPQGPALFWK